MLEPPGGRDGGMGMHRAYRWERQQRESEGKEPWDAAGFFHREVLNAMCCFNPPPLHSKHGITARER